jgi:outer membrane protein TolC
MDQQFQVETIVNFIPEIQIDKAIQTATQFNVNLLQERQNTQINAYDIKVSQSGYLPVIGLVGSYGWNLNQSPASAFFPGTNNNSYSMSFGANLSWNLFDGRALTRVKNSKITLDNQKIRSEETKLRFERDLSNALQTYKNSLKIYTIQEKQVETGTYNFERSEAQYKLGSITSIEFRQAQVNLRNAQNQWTLSKYEAKLAELSVLKLCGQLLNISL